MWPSAYSTSAAAAAAGALPQTLQRRLVRFLIRRTLGHLLRGADVDLDAVDVQLGRGVVELRDLALDESVGVVSLPLL